MAHALEHLPSKKKKQNLKKERINTERSGTRRSVKKNVYRTLGTTLV
jgi:hypothetical protein